MCAQCVQNGGTLELIGNEIYFSWHLMMLNQLMLIDKYILLQRHLEL